MPPRLRALTAAMLTCVALLLGAGPALGSPAPPTPVVVAADERPQTDQEEAAEVRHVLVMVVGLAVLTVVVGVLAARRR